jgi:hypothetical protein
MRTILLLIVCVVALYLIYVNVPRCDRKIKKDPHKEAKNKRKQRRKDGNFVVLSLSDNGVATFLEVPEDDIKTLKAINFNGFVYYFYGNGIFKKSLGSEMSTVRNGDSIRLEDGSVEAKFVSDIRYGRKYKIVKTEKHYGPMSSTSAFSKEDYDLVVRTLH